MIALLLLFSIVMMVFDGDGWLLVATLIAVPFAVYGFISGAFQVCGATQLAKRKHTIPWTMALGVLFFLLAQLLAPILRLQMNVPLPHAIWIALGFLTCAVAGPIGRHTKMIGSLSRGADCLLMTFSLSGCKPASARHFRLGVPYKRHSVTIGLLNRLLRTPC